jgi:tRNA (adenine57-N1/adenine58-N1)-methyltransferase
MFKEGDYLLIVHGNRKYLRVLNPKDSINVGREVLKFKDILGKEEGFRVGNFSVFKPRLNDIIMLGFRRKTQIIYPKDAFYIAFRLGIDNSSRVLEFGTGSGALCAVLSTLAGEVYTYERERKFLENAHQNLQRFGLGNNVRFFNEDFSQAQLEDNYFDAAFIDVKVPEEHTEKVYRLLKPGAVVGFLLPTTNQVASLLKTLQGRFGDIEVSEILHRFYKTNPERLRPEDSMVGHTAYLLFARKIS